jgi:hypothetical protein
MIQIRKPMTQLGTRYLSQPFWFEASGLIFSVSRFGLLRSRWIVVATLSVMNQVLKTQPSIQSQSPEMLRNNVGKISMYMTVKIIMFGVNLVLDCFIEFKSLTMFEVLSIAYMSSILSPLVHRYVSLH